MFYFLFLLLLLLFGGGEGGCGFFWHVAFFCFGKTNWVFLARMMGNGRAMASSSLRLH